MNLSIKNKILCGLLSTIFCIFCFSGIIINVKNQSATKNFNQDLLTASYHDVHQSITLLITQVWNILNTLDSSSVNNSLAIESLAKNTLDKDGKPLFENIYAVNDAQNVVASSNTELLGTNLSDKNYWTKTQSGTHFELLERGSDVIAVFALRKGNHVLVAELNNDKISDLAQSARPYPASSDNYLFTLKDSNLGPAATAISRSAFEKDLLAGIPTKFGEIKVTKNTEIELKFLDPNTQKPTRGVAEIIQKGSVIDLQGYPDYRGVPVVGIGGLIKFSDDFTAGLISEADLNGVNIGIHGRDEETLNFLLIIGLCLFLVTALVVWFIANKITDRIKRINKFLENEDDLSFRLYEQDPDELGTLVLGINDFLNKREISFNDVYKYQQMIEQMPVNLMLADHNGIIIHANPQTMKTLEPYKSLLPVPLTSLIGNTYDVFHKNPSRVRNILKDPSNLPHSAIVDLGPEKLSLTLIPIFDKNKNYAGPMLVWEMVTEKLELQNKSKEGSKRLEETVLGITDATAERANLLQNSITSVVSATEEMIASIREIASNTSTASDLTRKTVSETEVVEKVIENLKRRSQEIGDILTVVTSIAHQTNLLALNATIEAARAGESGRGFAVVANEVKELASQTNVATDDIKNKIVSIQDETNIALESIKTTAESVRTVSDLVSSISGAIEQQTSVTGDIGENMMKANSQVDSVVKQMDEIKESVKTNIAIMSAN